MREDISTFEAKASVEAVFLYGQGGLIHQPKMRGTTVQQRNFWIFKGVYKFPPYPL